MSNALQDQALSTVFDRYNRHIMNNIQRGDYVECLVDALLGPEWTLPWKRGYDWAPWDLKHDSKCKIEVRQSAALQTWPRPKHSRPKPPKFDIAHRKGYWTRCGKWIREPGRHADIYIFAWHPEQNEDVADHRAPEQWMFYVVPTKALPEKQRIGLAEIESLTRPVRSESLTLTVAQLLSALSSDANVER